MKRAFGGRLAYFIRDRFEGVWSALGLGVVLTLILQSSTASALLAASLGVQGEAGPAVKWPEGRGPSGLKRHTPGPAR